MQWKTEIYVLELCFLRSNVESDAVEGCVIGFDYFAAAQYFNRDHCPQVILQRSVFLGDTIG